MNSEFEVRSDECKRYLKFIFKQVEGYFIIEQEGGITRWKVHWGDRLAEWNSEMQNRYFSHFVKGDPEHDALAEVLKGYGIALLMLVIPPLEARPHLTAEHQGLSYRDCIKWTQD